MSSSLPLTSPIPLQKSHQLAAFNCGVVALNDYLHKHAWNNHQGRSARTYVSTRADQVVGYYTIAAGSVSIDETPPRVAKGLGKYPVPIILLARLAVDLGEQGKGLGAALLKDAILRSAKAADIVGCRAIVVHAKDPVSRTFYSKFGFESSPINELHLYLLMKDVIASLTTDS